MAMLPRLVCQNESTFCRHSLSQFGHNLFRKSQNLSVREYNAGQVLDKMPERDVQSATALISQLAKQNKHKEAIFNFLSMLDSNFKPNEYTFGTLLHSSIALQDLNLGMQIHAYATKINLSSNVFVGSAVMDLYVKLSTVDEAQIALGDIPKPNVVSYSTMICGFVKERRFDEAQEAFRTMPERNVVAWNTMITGYSQAGKNEEAVDLFIEMLQEGVVPNPYTYPCVVIAAANIGALGIGRSIHACAMKFSGDPGLFLSNSLVSFYAKCGSMDNSLLAFRKICKRNIVSWNALICGYAQNGQGKEAIVIYKEMKQSGLEPNSVTLLGLLSACTHAGLVDEGYKYFNQARCNNPGILNPKHYACMIDLFSRSGRFKEAKKFLHNLPFNDLGVGFWKALLGGCQVHSNLELGEVAARRILELDPGDVSSYVMLSNAHSAAGRWESVAQTRRRMREKGLERIPGSSWIEIKNNVNVFVTCDNRHGNKDEIYWVLGHLLDHAMDRRGIHILPRN